jgi:D-beta-D-heptose 7-phosphate kinase/D-beta-D-heptose 1-phosphate adenosyltransferase
MQTIKKVWVNGCFDVLHRGHIELFKFAKSKGNYLIVGIDEDQRIKKAKGPDRPINNTEDRKYFLESIKYIDEVVTFSSDASLIEAVKNISPNYMVVGSDWKGKKVIGSEYANQIIFFNRVGDYSTTKILEKK